MPSRSLTTTLALALALSSVLVGCGRRGELEPPSSTVAPAAVAGQKPAKEEKSSSKESVPERHFILDPLIQ